MTTGSELFVELSEDDEDGAAGWELDESIFGEHGIATAPTAEEASDDESAQALFAALDSDEGAAEDYADTEYADLYEEPEVDEATDDEVTYLDTLTDSGELDTYHRSRRRDDLPDVPPTPGNLCARVARIAEQEYRRWHPAGASALVEDHPDATPVLQDYYRTGVGVTISSTKLQNKQWQEENPWSAVFVSWVMRKAGAGQAFTYSRGHQDYIRAARKNRLTGNSTNPFWAFRATEIAPQVGDLVCRARANSGADYDNIADKKRRKTHCDIVTAVRPGEIRVIGGNVHQNVDSKRLLTQPDGRLRLDGAQADYFAVIRCNGATSPSPKPSTAQQVRAGRHVVARLPLLTSHTGTPPDLILKWNDMAPTTAVDVVVHLHGWAREGVGRKLDIARDKLPVSGLDFTEPGNPAAVGRTAATLMVLPRGSHSPAGKDDRRYTFPALVKPGALQRLIDESLAIFAAQTGLAVQQNHLILTAHSGGGAALMQILRHTNPDEIHAFDALYTDPAALIAWAKRRMASGTGALRVIYRPGEGTAAHSQRVAHAIAGAGSPRFGVEQTSVAHENIPATFGWRLLADPSANLPGVVVIREAEADSDFGELDESFDEADEALCAHVDGEWSEEPEFEDIADEDITDEGTAEEFADEDIEGEWQENSSGHTEPMPTGEDEESSQWDETWMEEPVSEEFGGAEHKHIGDRASGKAQTTIAYGSPPQWLSFGDVVSMAGDYFASYFDMNELSRTAEGRMELAWARWHCLGLKSDGVAEPAATVQQKKSVTDRYFGLASRNLSHFSAGGNATATYAKWHSDALVDALEAGQTGNKSIWRRALTKEAFADHFLTDSFSAGHVRTPRADIKQWYDTNMAGSNDALLRYMARFIFNRLDERQQLPPIAFWYGLISRLWGNEILKADISKTGGEATNTFSIGDILSLALHNYDNKGLDVVSVVGPDGQRPPGGYRWRAVGDGHLGLRRKQSSSRPSKCAPVFSAASGLTTTMAIAAVTASLRDLERVRGVGTKLGKRQLKGNERVDAIKQGLGAKTFAALDFIPKVDSVSTRNTPLQANSGTSLDWRWGRLGDMAYRAVDETIKCQIADDLEALIPSVADPAIAKKAGMTLRIYGTRNAFRAFVKQLRTSGVKAIEDAVGKAAR
jgi:hypothetical protein